MVEIGVYILGATALALLGATGIAFAMPMVAVCAIVAAGAAYMAQLMVFNEARIPNLIFMVLALASWCGGVALLLL